MKLKDVLSENDRYMMDRLFKSRRGDDDDEMPKPKRRRESPMSRRQREMRDHKFSDSIGGFSGNYRK